MCRLWIREVVDPPNLRKYLLCTSACDNLGHNPSSTTASDSFHGTGISIMQHHNQDVPGMAGDLPIIEQEGPVKKPCLNFQIRIQSYHLSSWVRMTILFPLYLDQPDQSPRH